MPEVDEAQKYKEQMLVAKKRASELQNEIDSFSKERKSFQNIAEENVELAAKLSLAQSVIAEQAAKLSETVGEKAKVEKQLAKVGASVEAAQKIRDGLAGLA